MTRFIINVPPRSLKSHIVSTAFKAFVLGHFPWERIVGASYSGKLATKFNIEIQLIMNSPWYKEIFPHTRFLKETEGKLLTTHNGMSYATSTGGTVTGEGGNYLFADDLVNPEDAASPTGRTNANEWFRGTFLQRADDAAKMTIGVIMQRLHEEDLTGFLLETNARLPPEMRWVHIKLPSYAEEDTTLHYYGLTKHWKAGEPLHPSRQDIPFLTSKEVDIGSYSFSAQYQQEPAPKDGGMLDIKKFGRYIEVPDPATVIRRVQSWDTAIKADKQHDFSVCITADETKTNTYIRDVVIMKAEYPELKAFVIAHAARFNPHAILIEDKSSGLQLNQDLRRETKLPIVPIQVPSKADWKIIRVASISPIIMTGQVKLPHDAELQPWWNEFWKQITYFPNGKNDDVPDTLGQLLDYLRTTGMNNWRIRVL